MLQKLMQLIPAVLLSALLSVAGFDRAANAGERPLHVATYIDTIAAKADAAAALLKEAAIAERRQDGCEGTEVLREIGRDDRFLVLEVWRDQAAWEKHEGMADTETVRTRLAAMEAAPPDRRILTAIEPRLTNAPNSGSAALWIVTHIDVMPDHQAVAADKLKALAEKSRTETGSLQFVAALQPSRTNHFTLIEEWADRAAFDAHEASEKTRRFRAELAPMLGALYDARLYRKAP